MKKKLIGLIIGIFSFSIVSASAATELKLATFEPPKASVSYTHLTLPTILLV